MHIRFKSYGSFAGPGKQARLLKHKFLSWEITLLCIVVELAGEGLAIDGASFEIGANISTHQ